MHASATPFRAVVNVAAAAESPVMLPPGSERRLHGHQDGITAAPPAVTVTKHKVKEALSHAAAAAGSGRGVSDVRRAASAHARLNCDSNCAAVDHGRHDRHMHDLHRAVSVPHGLQAIPEGKPSSSSASSFASLLLTPARKISRSFQSLLSRSKSRVAPADSIGSLDSATSDEMHELPTTPRRTKRRRTSQVQAVSVVTAVCPHGHEVRTVGWGGRSKSVVCRCGPWTPTHDGAGTPTLEADVSDTESEAASMGTVSVVSDGRHMGPLHLAAVSGDRAAMRSLLAMGNVHVDLPDADGVTPFMLSVLAGQFKCAEDLLKHGAQQDRKDKHGRTVMHWVVYNGLRRALVWLFKHGADWRLADNAGRTPLHWATDSADLRCMSLLLRRTPVSYLNQQDGQGMTALCWAAHHGHVEQIRLLLKRGADPRLRNTMGRAAIHFAACNAEPDCLLTLVKASPTCIFDRDNEGRTPLHTACSHGSLSTARALMGAYERFDRAVPKDSASASSTCLVQCCDSQNRTPLHCAAVTGRWRIAQELIDRGHDPECIDDANHMPIWYARVKNHPDTVNVIAKAIVQWHASRQ